MARKSMVMEFGMGTDLHGGDYTRAAVRAVEAVLRRNALTFADALGVPMETMHFKVAIGVARPDRVDTDRVAAVLRHGTAEVSVEEGGMDIPRESGDGAAVLANAAVTVFLDVPEDRIAGAAS